MMNAARGADLAVRTRQFAIAIIRLYSRLPRSTVSQVLGRQMLRSGTSVGAQYREAIRAKSVADFISKIEGSLQEIEETRYWLELMIAHHEGAVAMAEEQAAEGTFRPAVELAEDVVAGQTAEIEQMRALLG